MKNLKNIFAAIILLSTLTTTILTASTSNEIESNCFVNSPVMTLNIPALNFSADIQLLHSTYDAPVTIEISSGGGTIYMLVDALNAAITADGINPRGVSMIVTGDGINTLNIHADGINPRSATGDNAVAITVSQFGSVLYTNAR